MSALLAVTPIRHHPIVFAATTILTWGVILLVVGLAAVGGVV